MGKGSAVSVVRRSGSGAGGAVFTKRRARTDVGVTGRAGYNDQGNLMGGVDFFFNVTPRFQVGGLVTTSQGDLTDELAGKEISDAEVLGFSSQRYSYLFQGRFFLTDTFYLGGGAGVRIIDFDLLTEGTGEEQLNVYQGKSTVVHGMIGNMWTLSNGITLGIDWGAYTMPASTEIASDLPMEPGVTETDIMAEAGLDTVVSQSEAGSWQAAVVHVGFML